jgi:Tfp pilus assembly protein PilO
MNFIVPIILIVASLGVFFGYVDPNYRGTGTINTSDYSSYGIVPLQAELLKFQKISDDSNAIVSKRETLVKKKNAITEADQTKLEKLLPSNIDNIRLIIEISNIAAKRNLLIKNVSVGDVKQNTNSIGPNNSAYGILAMSFSVNSSYVNFLNLLQDLEANLRIVDITNISFSATDSGFYDFSVSFNTYWLK